MLDHVDVLVTFQSFHDRYNTRTNQEFQWNAIYIQYAVAVERFFPMTFLVTFQSTVVAIITRDNILIQWNAIHNRHALG